jgi:hypothetical protein
VGQEEFIRMVQGITETEKQSEIKTKREIEREGKSKETKRERNWERERGREREGERESDRERDPRKGIHTKRALQRTHLCASVSALLRASSSGVSLHYVDLALCRVPWGAVS